MSKVNNSINSSIVQYVATGIDVTIIGSVPLFTTLAGTQNFYVSGVILIQENLVGVPSVVQLDIGYTFPNYDDIFTGPMLTFTVSGEYYTSDQSGGRFSAPPSTPILANITTASTAATCTYTITLLGFYQ